MEAENRKLRIKEILVERLNLAVEPADIADDAPLFTAIDEGGLGLDSVDALELAVAMNGEFDVEIGDEDMGIFESVARMAAFVEERLVVAV
jgi:acyl carrier protein